MLTYTLIGIALAAVVYLFTREKETEEVVEMEGWEANPSQDLRRPLSDAFTRF